MLARRVKGWVRLIGGLAAQFIYPPTCPACGDETAEDGGLCSTCWREIAFIAGPICDTCGVPVYADTFGRITCDACAHAPPVWSRGRAAVVYDGAGRRLILALKHGDRLDIAPLLGGWMARAGAELSEFDIIAPTPLHWSRLIKRRFNQAGELAREAASALDRKDALTLDLLSRHRRTATQDGKSRTARFQNVTGAFDVSDRWRAHIRGKRVLLVDDVLTTGATLSACAEACLQAGAMNVNVLAFARVAREDHLT
ncbi:MAG: ComF family protein [Pikeienuella sp.]